MMTDKPDQPNPLQLLPPITPVPRLVRACRHDVLDRPPVWLMRQAGRYMPEYRVVREKMSFLELCKTPEKATEVSLQPFHAFGMDAVIMFCDILIPAEAMGMALHFDDHGPRFTEPIGSRADIDRLIVPDPHEAMGFVMTLLRQLRQELVSYPDVTLIGFAGAPWTLATYMMEGGVSKQFSRINHLMYDEPALLHQLLAQLTQTITAYLNAQIEAGAQVLQLFDTWGGIHSLAVYRKFIQPYEQQVIEQIRGKDVPIILYINGSGHLLEAMAETGADVISLDWKISLTEGRQRLGSHQTIQGNLDPTALLACPDVLKPMILEMLSQGGNRNYIVNVGHGVIPETPVAHVRLLVETVKQARYSPTGVLLGHTPVSSGQR